MNDLIEFLTRCNDEDEAAAKEAGFTDAAWACPDSEPATIEAVEDDGRHSWTLMVLGRDFE